MSLAGIPRILFKSHVGHGFMFDAPGGGFVH